MTGFKKLPPATEGNPDYTLPPHDTEPGKEESMLIHFAQGKRLHRFSAERLADHCLPSTVSSLQRKHSIEFSREWVEVPNRFRKQTRVKLYYLQGEHLFKAQAIVSGRVKL
jgi:hypothetical protein